MGKTSRFFKTIFKSQTLHHLPYTSLTPSRHTPRHHRSSVQTTDCSTNHAIVVADAAEVVRMMNRITVSGSDYGVAGKRAAVKIQAYYRGYQARNALRVIKSLVKLQALARGHIIRKQVADDLRRLQALARVQARVRSCRVQVTESPQSITKMKKTENAPTAYPLRGSVCISRLMGLL